MDFAFKNNRKPQKGMVLLSDPFFKDNYFSRSVIYICEHNNEGSFGFVLSNYININLAEISRNFPYISNRVSIGGPVQTERIFTLHFLGDRIPDSIEIADGIYVGGDYDILVEQIKEKLVDDTKVRFFLGYSGWGSGQLEQEIEQNNWIVSPIHTPLEIFNTSIGDLWNRFMEREGKKYAVLSKSPLDFNDN